MILIIIILLAPDGNSPTQRHEVDDIITREKAALETLRKSTFGNPGNLTGISRYGPVPPELIREKVKEMTDEVMGDYLRGIVGVEPTGNAEVRIEGSRESLSLTDAKASVREAGPKSVIGGNSKTKRVPTPNQELPLYRNASGTIHGEWSRLQIPGFQVPQTNQTYYKNITIDSGKITFNIEEKEPAEVQEVAMTMIIKNEQGGDSQDVTLFGVHFTRTGEMVLTTSSERLDSGSFSS